MAKWFRKGKDGIQESQKIDAAQKATRGDRGPIPFTLDYNSSAQYIFVDDPLFFLFIHTVKIGEKKYMRLTCIRDIETCPACEQKGDNPAYAVVGTVIDTRPFTKKDGTKVRFSKKPFIAKGKAREIVLRRLEENGGHLRGYMMKNTRGSTQTEANVGEDMQVVRKLTKEQIQKTVPEGETLKEWFKPLDYEKIFAPKTAKEMADILGVDPPLGSDDNENIFGDDDDAPTEKKGKAASNDDDPFAEDTAGETEEKADVLDGGSDDDASIDDLLDD